MAQRRMFSLQIVDTDAFLDMSIDAQCLYFHLGMRADDDGLVANPKRIARGITLGITGYNELITRRFILELPNGIIAIKHWKIQNEIKNDRYHKTKYADEFKLLKVKDNGAYTECIQIGSRSGYKLEPEVSIGNTNNKGLASKEARRGPEKRPGGMQSIGSLMREKKEVL